MLVADGRWFTIECAVRRDLSSPVAEFLSDLRAGGLDSEDEHLKEADEQINWFEWFVAACEHVARTGMPVHNGAYNQLRNGIWEFKHGTLRVTFYDTDGSGGHTPKIDATSLTPFGRRRWPADFDQYLHLTTAFEKRSQRTPAHQLALAETVREEDLNHDR